MTDQSGWHGVEDLAQKEAAGGCDTHRDFLVIRGPPGGQRLEAGPFGIDAFGIAGVDPAGDLVDEAAIGIQILEVARPAHDQRVLPLGDAAHRLPGNG